MSTLAGLFANDERARRADVDAGGDDAVRTLDHVVGPRRQTTPPTRVNVDTTRLVALVDAAERDTSPAAFAPSAATSKGRRRPRRIDWINVSAAVLATVVVVGTVGFAGVQAAGASPAAVASQALDEDRAALASAEQGMNAALERFTTEVTTGETQAAAARSAILGLDETVVDAAARSTVVAAADSYIASLGGVVLPALPEPYTATEVDEESLTAVAAALDEVRERSAEVDDAVTEIRALRTTVEQRGTVYLQALTTFAATFTARAAIEVDENPVADQEFRDAVIAAAATLATAPLNEASGQQALTAYQDAVLALRDDDLRARIAEEEQREAENNFNNNNNGGGGEQGGEGDGGTTPPAETPTEPVTPPVDGEDPLP